MTPLIGFSPDAEPQTPGCITDCQNIVPYEGGMRVAPQPVSVGFAALASECRGSAVLRNLSGASRFFSGTATKLYEASGTTWTDVSRGANYTQGAEDRWSFAQFGNNVLAATITAPIQRSTSGAFSDIAGAPKAKVIVSAKGFVLAFHTDEATYNNSPDRWWCCALYDETSWTPSVTTQATTGRVINGQGGFKAAAPLGDDVVAYKERGLFVGRYQGPPAVWDWTPVAEEVGCVGQDALAQTSIGHVFVGQDNIYLFDGTRPFPLATGTVRQWWIDNSSGQYRSRSKVLWDRQNNLVWIYFPSKFSTGACDYCLVFHVLKRQWGRADNTAQAVVNYYTQGGGSYDSPSAFLSSIFTTYNSTAPSPAYDSVLWLNEKEAPAIFNASNQLQALEGGADDSSFTTGDYSLGDMGASMCRGVRIQWAQQPSIADCIGYTRDGSGKALVQASAVELGDSAFDVRQTGRVHRFRFELSGDCKFSAIDPELVSAGRR